MKNKYLIKKIIAPILLSTTLFATITSTIAACAKKPQPEKQPSTEETKQITSDSPQDTTKEPEKTPSESNPKAPESENPSQQEEITKEFDIAQINSPGPGPVDLTVEVVLNKYPEQNEQGTVKNTTVELQYSSIDDQETTFTTQATHYVNSSIINFYLSDLEPGKGYIIKKFKVNNKAIDISSFSRSKRTIYTVSGELTARDRWPKNITHEQWTPSQEDKEKLPEKWKEPSMIANGDANNPYPLVGNTFVGYLYFNKPLPQDADVSKFLISLREQEPVNPSEHTHVLAWFGPLYNNANFEIDETDRKKLKVTINNLGWNHTYRLWYLYFDDSNNYPYPNKKLKLEPHIQTKNYRMRFVTPQKPEDQADVQTIRRERTSTLEWPGSYIQKTYRERFEDNKVKFDIEFNGRFPGITNTFKLKFEETKGIFSLTKNNIEINSSNATITTSNKETEQGPVGIMHVEIPYSSLKNEHKYVLRGVEFTPESKVNFPDSTTLHFTLNIPEENEKSNSSSDQNPPTNNDSDTPADDSNNSNNDSEIQAKADAIQQESKNESIYSVQQFEDVDFLYDESEQSLEITINSSETTPYTNEDVNGAYIELVDIDNPQTPIKSTGVNLVARTRKINFRFNNLQEGKYYKLKKAFFKNDIINVSTASKPVIVE